MVNALRHFLLLLLSLACAHAAEVQVLLDANRIATGEGANLTIRVIGGRAEKPVMPEVPNLTLDFQAQNQMFSMVNGVTTQTVSFLYLVGSQVPGEYVIPPIVVKVDGKEMTTKPQTITVFDDGSNAAGNAKIIEPPDPNRLGTMSVELAVQDRNDIYLGEIAPVRIQAWFPVDARVQLRSIIQPESGSFTLHNVGNQPQQTSEQKDGKQYNVLTWFGGISATKAGSQAVKLSMKALVALPDRSKPVLRPRAGSAGQFNPFGRGAGVRYKEQEVTIVSDGMSLLVKALPEEGKPANFSGAVGEFAFDALEIPADWKTGEPQRVALRISGSGNFANMKAPELSPAELWKWYPGQDQFTPGDVASFSGSKVFQYNAIARNSGNYPVAFELAYFDPKQAAYQVIRSQEKTVTITGEAVTEEKPAAESIAAPQPETPEDGRAPLRVRVSKPFAQMIGLRGIDPLRVSLLAIALAVVAPILSSWQRKLRDPQRRAREQQQKEIRDAMKQTEHALQQQDATLFWSSALRVMQLSLSQTWQVSPAAITLHDVTVRCGASSSVTAFFREADRWTYGAVPSAPDWTQWRALYQQALASLGS